MPDPIDWPQLKKRCLNDDAFVDEMLSVFSQHATGLLEKIRSAAEDGDVEAVRKLAHTLKGSAANLAAEPLRSVAFSIETAARTEDAAAVTTALPALDAAFAACTVAIARYREAKQHA